MDLLLIIISVSNGGVLIYQYKHKSGNVSNKENIKFNKLRVINREKKEKQFLYCQFDKHEKNMQIN